MSIAPHGGALVNRFLSGGERDAALKRAQAMPKLQIDAYAAFDLDGIAKGIFSPLTGFMGSEDVQNVLDTMHLRPGVPWTIPILLAATKAQAERFEVGQPIALVDDTGEIAAVLHLSEKFDVNRKTLCQKVYGTTEEAHPGVAYTQSLGEVFLAGEVDVLKERTIEFQDYNLPPAATREAFEQRGWRRIVAFQTRNPIHRAHEYLTKCALEICDGLLIHPLMGTTKEDDIPGNVRMKCYQTLMDNYYPKDHVMLSLMPVNMRYAGPMEAIMHAIYRKNYGCTHFIVGRDHAGVGSYYGTYDAHRIFDQFDPAEIGILPLFFDHAFYSKRTNSMASTKTCPGTKEDHVFLSGTKVREMLNAGQMPPEEFTRPEVARILIEWAQSQ